MMQGIGNYLKEILNMKIFKYYSSMNPSGKRIYCPMCHGNINQDGSPSYVQYKKQLSPSVTTDAVVIRKHKDDDYYDILMIQRKFDPFKDYYAFPGGFVEYNEDPQNACLRELQEETNLTGKNIELVLKYEINLNKANCQKQP